jgi:uncharacterized protein with ATP-grasp and redox domains
MKTDNWNLSDKIKLFPDGKYNIECIPAFVVAEFVRRLKEMFEERKPYEVIYKEIDKLAGEKLENER